MYDAEQELLLSLQKTLMSSPEIQLANCTLCTTALTVKQILVECHTFQQYCQIYFGQSPLFSSSAESNNVWFSKVLVFL